MRALRTFAEFPTNPGKLKAGGYQRDMEANKPKRQFFRRQRGNRKQPEKREPTSCNIETANTYIPKVECPNIPVKMFGKNLNELVDSGAEISLIHVSLIPKGFDIEKYRVGKITLVSVTGHRLPPTDYVRFYIKIHDRIIWHTFVIHTGKLLQYKVLLGVDFLQKYVETIGNSSLTLKPWNKYPSVTIGYSHIISSRVIIVLRQH